MDTIVSITQDEFDNTSLEECGCQTKIVFGGFEQKPPVKIIHDFAFYFSIDCDINKTVRYRVYELEFDDVTRFSHSRKPACGFWSLTIPNGTCFEVSSGKYIEDYKVCLYFNFYSVTLDFDKRAGILKDNKTGKITILDESVIGVYVVDELTIGAHNANLYKPDEPKPQWCDII